MKLTKRKNGFSIVECIIALTVVIIVSFTALSILLSAVSAKVTSVDIAYAQRFADNAWECFKAADNENEFIDFMRFAEGVTLTGSDGNYSYVSEENKFTAEISVAGNEFGIRVFFDNNKEDRSDDEEIISFNYTKGGN